MLAALVACGVSQAVAPATAATVAATPAGQSADEFYAAHGDRPIWFGPALNDPAAARALLDLLRTAEADGLDPRRYDIARIEAALAAAGSGSLAATAAADRLLSEAFVAFVRDLRRASSADMMWVDSDLRPMPPAPREMLSALASSADPVRFVRQMDWMNPVYGRLRQALVDPSLPPAERALLRLNLERARALPAPTGRYILVNAAAARLEMHEDGRMVDSMRVVVGKPAHATPMLAARIRYTSLNPYWNVPPDLTAERIAPNVLKEGLSYLKAKGYQVFASWDEDSPLLDPATVDWAAVADGRSEVRIRQLPGPHNGMGLMKFMFPNRAGIYLHDTPQKELLSEASRMFSGGCIRLEDAPRLAQWLYGRPLKPAGSAPEQRVDLKDDVAVFITYLTAVPEQGRVAFLPDVYDRDRQALARLGSAGQFASR
ncbi:L,D-transpeptidase family protein [Sphingomonas mesophila]|uniref:L,D-transpeptidase family protein n=1 Tax=Sphingomonas mesophila TaxID=2303576 RepID=UPI001F076421|nr:L,D-transpeptidase family protein [Sphingomonas mesophila]